LTYPLISWELFNLAARYYIVSSVIESLTWCSVSIAIVSDIMASPLRYCHPNTRNMKNEYDYKLQTIWLNKVTM